MLVSHLVTVIDLKLRITKALILLILILYYYDLMDSDLKEEQF